MLANFQLPSLSWETPQRCDKAVKLRAFCSRLLPAVLELAFKSIWSPVY